MIVWTDGMDNQGWEDIKKDVVDEVSDRHITVHSIMVGEDAEPTLHDVAHSTGGTVHAVHTQTAMRSVVDDVAKIMAENYMNCTGRSAHAGTTVPLVDEIVHDAIDQPVPTKVIIPQHWGPQRHTLTFSIDRRDGHGNGIIKLVDPSGGIYDTMPMPYGRSPGQLQPIDDPAPGQWAVVVHGDGVWEVRATAHVLGSNFVVMNTYADVGATSREWGPSSSARATVTALLGAPSAGVASAQVLNATATLTIAHPSGKVTSLPMHDQDGNGQHEAVVTCEHLRAHGSHQLSIAMSADPGVANGTSITFNRVENVGAITVTSVEACSVPPRPPPPPPIPTPTPSCGSWWCSLLRNLFLALSVLLASTVFLATTGAVSLA